MAGRRLGRVRRLGCLASALLLLACSSRDPALTKPAELTPLKTQLPVRTVWKVDVGAGKNLVLEPAVLDAIHDGDAVMVKGSLGSKMGSVVKALEKQFPRQAMIEQSMAQG